MSNKKEKQESYCQTSSCGDAVKILVKEEREISSSLESKKISCCSSKEPVFIPIAEVNQKDSCCSKTNDTEREVVMQIISVREQPEYKEKAIKYFQSKWANENSMKVYENCITHSITTDSPLPIWYLMEDAGVIIGCAGLISNDFISRMDLWPWICALYIEKSYRGRSLGKELLLRAKADAEKAGFNRVFLCTDHIGYYEKHGFTYIGDGYHPWGSSSRIYESNNQKNHFSV